MSEQRTQGVFGGTAWSVARVRGIDVAIDRSWIVIFLLITYSLSARFGAEHADWQVAARWSAALFASLLFFISIVLHELGHSLTALRLGVNVRSITLFLFGGLARLDSEPQRPRDEILIAVAGPLTSVALGVGFLVLAAVIPPSGRIPEMLHTCFSWLGMINLVLAAFNVLPGFPLDGGRVLRGVVWAMSGSFERATRSAAASGSLLAYSLMALGALAALQGALLGGLWLAFIGWFLLSTARMTVVQATFESILARIRSGDVMEPVESRRLSGAETVQQVAEGAVMLHGLRTLYVVDAAGGLRGLVTLGDLARTPAERRPFTRVDEVMRPADSITTLAPDASTWSAFRAMAEGNVNQVPVVERGRLLGAVTRERLLALVQAGMALEPA